MSDQNAGEQSPIEQNAGEPNAGEQSPIEQRAGEPNAGEPNAVERSPGDATAGHEPSVKKPRSPVERTIVWGAIVGMLAVALFEAHARVGYDQTRKTLEAALLRNEEHGEEVTARAAEGMVRGWPLRTDSQDARGTRQIEYTWPSIFHEYGIVLTLVADRTDDDPLREVVLDFATSGADEEEFRDAPVVHVDDEMLEEQEQEPDTGEGRRTGRRAAADETAQADDASPDEVPEEAPNDDAAEEDASESSDSEPEAEDD
jgi:hypothetical protein